MTAPKLFRFPLTLIAKLRTLSNSLRSSSQTSMTSFRPVCFLIYCFAASPLVVSRAVMMNLVAPSRTMCFAASRPSPAFSPVMMIVWSPNYEVGKMEWKKNCEQRRYPTVAREGPDMSLVSRLQKSVVAIDSRYSKEYGTYIICYSKDSVSCFLNDGWRM